MNKIQAKPVELNLMSIYFSGAKANNLFSLCPSLPVSPSNIQRLIQAQPLAHHTILSSFYYIKYICDSNTDKQLNKQLAYPLLQESYDLGYKILWSIKL